jgi:hypothetical protein
MLAKVKAFIRSNVYDLEPYPKLNSGVRLKFRDTPMRYILGLSPILPISSFSCETRAVL